MNNCVSPFLLLQTAPTTCLKRKVKIDITVVQNDLMTTHCCKESCLRYVPLETAMKGRSEFWSQKTQANQRNFIISNIRQAILDEKGRRFFRIMGCKQNLCRKAWSTIYGISSSRYLKYKKHF